MFSKILFIITIIIRSEAIGINLDIESVLSGRLEVAQCLSKCSRFDSSGVDHDSCMGMCLEPHMCEYSWLCTGTDGCIQGCSSNSGIQVNIVQLWQDEDEVFWRMDGASVSILLGLDSTQMWSIIGEPGVYTQYKLDQYTQNRFKHLAVVAVSESGIQDSRILEIIKFKPTTTSTTTEESEIIHEKLVDLPEATEISAYTTQDILLFILALITTIVTFITLVLFCCIIKSKRSKYNKTKPLKKVKLSPIIKDYSKVPSNIV